MDAIKKVRTMRHLFDQDDEQAVLNELARNQRNAEQFVQTCIRRGQPQQASNWTKSAHRIGQRFILLEGAFRHKN